MYVEAWGRVKFKSIQLQKEVSSRTTHCEALWGQAERWNHKIISHCFVRHPHPPTRWDFSGAAIRINVILWKFEKVLQKSQLDFGKMSSVVTFIQKPQSPAIRRRRLPCPLWLFHSLWCGDEKQFLTWKMKVCRVSLFLLCFTQGPGLSTHTKWEACLRLSSASDGWRGEKNPKQDWANLKRKGQRPEDSHRAQVKLGFNFRSLTLNRRQRSHPTVHQNRHSAPTLILCAFLI